MTWVKIDDGFFDNLANRELGSAARDLFVASLCFCAKGLTDGRIPKSDVKMLLASAQSRPKTVQLLVDFGRWIEHETHYEVANYLQYNPSREKVLADREAAAQRMRQRRSSPERSRGTNRRSSPERSATPSRPVPIPPSGSQTTTVIPDPQGAGRAAPTDDLWNLLADRRATLEQSNGTTITHPDRYHTTIANDYRTRLTEHAKELTADHPDWNLSRLADELDPDTAEQHHRIPNETDTRRWLDERAGIDVAPMPSVLKAFRQ